jgi:molecular chaperone HtpG
MFKEQGQDAILLTHPIDNAFITYLEQHNEGISFQRIDAELHDSLKDDVSEDEKKDFKKTSDRLVKIFRRELANENLEVKIEKIKDENVSSMVVLSEQSRRMEEMMKMYSMGDLGPGMMGMGSTGTLVLNANHPLVKYVDEHKKGKTVSLICKQLYDVALLAHKPLSPDEMTEFVKRNNQVMMLLTKDK